ncbi:hypothetical protein KEB97_004259 [Salmonella enterica]|nr:hypothetical protein [Salmonella enterica]
MSELKIDNPAMRLFDILEKGKSHQATASCREVWKTLLQAQELPDHQFLSRLARVMELPERIVQVREDHFPALRNKSNYWRGKIETAFTSQSLNGRWDTFKNHIDERTLSELSLLSDIFETRGTHAGVAAEEIVSLLTRITELRTEIRNAELSFTMKTMLLRQLFQIQEALESYSISGVEPVMDAVQSTLGLAVLHPDYRSEISRGTNSKFGEKISDLLSDVANVVTVAGALPALTVAVNTALTYIGQ